MTLVKQFPLPNLFIPGVQKAGTTALASFLAQHPDVCLVEGKEAHVFDDPDFHRAVDKLKFAKKKYESKLKHYNGERYILDATPITLLHPQFISAAVNMCSNAKYIVMTRDPIERAMSHYAMSKKRGLESHSPLAAFWHERKRMKGFYEALPLSPFESPYRDQSYLIRSRYRQQLNSLYRLVDKGNVTVLRQQDLLSEHQQALAKIFSFLDVSTIPITQEHVFNTENSYTLPLTHRWLMKLYFMLRN